MNYRAFGKSGINVSELGFGCWAIGGNDHGISYGPVDDKDSIVAIEEALEAGCNYFDTADVYGWGHSEELLGSSLKSVRDRVVIATKVGSDFYQGYGFQTFSEEYILFAFNKSLNRLQTDYIDVYQLHNPPLDLIVRPETFSIFERLKKEGKVRAWGLSVTTAEESLAALEHARPDCLQIPINIFSCDRRMIEEVLPTAYKQGCALIAREPLANGFLSGKYPPNSTFPAGDMRSSWPLDYVNARVKASQDLEFLIQPGERTMAQAALQWVLKIKELSVAIVGCKTEIQVKENLGATDAMPLSAEELNKISLLQASNFGMK